MHETVIQSRHNEQVKNLVKLQKRKYRDRQERFLVEGLRELQFALHGGVALETLYYCPEYFPASGHADWIAGIRRAGTARLVRMRGEVFDKVSYREGPDGLLAVARQGQSRLEELALSRNPLLLVLEGIEKPGNLGAILRSADGAGVEAVLLVDCRLDLYNPNAIRSSQGLLFSLQVVAAEAEPLMRWMRERGIRSVATLPGAEDTLWEADFTGPSAIFLGAEHEGLSRALVAEMDGEIRIPMAGRADSLNVAATAAVVAYEARRQRDSGR